MVIHCNRVSSKFKRMFLYILLGMFGLVLHAQTVSVSGVVRDAQGETVPGASVVVRGGAIGTITDQDGRFNLNVPEGSVLVVSFVGFTPREVIVGSERVFNVTIEEDHTQLGDVVVIGYGQVRRGDLTGSVSSVNEREFQRGAVSNPTSLIAGRVAGVQITPHGGRAGEGNRIRIRGGASLNASNDPLIVVDGVPLAAGNISGQTNPLTSINPNDIETMTILKDASATAIYGSRASNGVIIITTKRGTAGQKLQVDVSSVNSIATIARRVDMMSGDEFRDAVRNNPYTSQRYIDMLGDANTDWQDEIFRNAFSSDNNISVSGSLGNIMPYRVSTGFLNQDGILDTDNIKRVTGGFNLSPSLFDNHLNVNMNMRWAYTHSTFGNSGAIGAALSFDPTQPVFGVGSAYDQFNGYWNWTDAGGGMTPQSTRNPVGMLHSRDDQGFAHRIITNVQADYKLHFFPDLRVNVNVGYDFSDSNGEDISQKWATDRLGTGAYREHAQQRQNLLFETYLNYAKQISSAHRIDIMGGYTYQDLKIINKTFPRLDLDKLVELEPAETPSTPRNTLISFFGRLNYNLLERYLLTATLRGDASSRFSKDNRWGVFPSFAFAWRLSEEGFMSGIDVLSNFKLRLGWGITGQQEGIGDYGHIARWSLSEETAQIQMGDNFYYAWRPAAYDNTRKWEETTTSNIGVDWGIFKNRISGSIDLFNKDTKDLFAYVDIPMGSNFINRMDRNIGTMRSRGIEFSIEALPVNTNDLQWRTGFNLTHTQSEITKLSLPGGNPTALVGGISGGIGTTIQANTVGYAPSSFFVFEQIYDPETGMPIEGLYVDRNDDGIFNSSDLYHYKNPAPKVFMGFHTSLDYKNWTLTTALRSNLGNYVYNNSASNRGSYAFVLNPNDHLTNAVVDIKNTNFYTRQLMSNYYVSNASFLKMDFIQVQYDFGQVAGMFNLRVNATVQNVFTVTKYEGVNPEIGNGIDNNFYPVPRTFSVGINMNF